MITSPIQKSLVHQCPLFLLLWSARVNPRHLLPRYRSSGRPCYRTKTWSTHCPTAASSFIRSQRKSTDTRSTQQFIGELATLTANFSLKTFISGCLTDVARRRKFVCDPGQRKIAHNCANFCWAKFPTAAAAPRRSRLQFLTFQHHHHRRKTFLLITVAS